MSNPTRTPLDAFAAAAQQLTDLFARLWASCFAEANFNADRDQAQGWGYISGEEVYEDALNGFGVALMNMHWHRVARDVSARPMAVAA